MLVLDFANKYQMTEVNILHFLKEYPEYGYIDEDNQQRVNEKKVVEDHSKVLKVWDLNTQMFYLLEEIYGSTMNLARELAKHKDTNAKNWNQFLSTKLFMIPSQSITNVRISRMQFLFYKYGMEMLEEYKRLLHSKETNNKEIRGKNDLQ